ncbi:MAG: methyltransferase domain-containing protein [Ignavibacteriales bacterium]|nr:methyltransferase domain-containing protein [Ignavibacteriales bacterium]
MSFLIPRRQFDPAIQEMMDRSETDPDVLRDDLANLRTINKYFGGLEANRKSILPLFQEIPAERELTILDLATGSADQPIALVRFARREGRKIRIVALDKNPVMLSVARAECSAFPEITIEERDLLTLPYPDNSFDFVLCSLAIHHFSRGDAIEILRSMKRLSRVALVVHDLHRSWITAWAAWLYTHLTTRNPITLFDSYLSARRAFTAEELESMAREAGVHRKTITRYPFFRLVLVGFPD